MNYSERAQALLDTKVRPWVEKLPWQDTHPVRFDESEGYKGKGVIGARSGPLECIDFDALAHEMAHAIEILECGRPQALERNGWGLRIKTSIRVGDEEFDEPITMQATAREAEVCGIQWRLMEMVGHPEVEGFAERHAKILASYMPDWIHGGKDAEERITVRERLIHEAYLNWPADRVRAGWMLVQPRLEALAQLQMQQQVATQPARRMGMR